MKPSDITTSVPPRAKDRVGETHGYWTVDSFSHIVKTGKAKTYYWNCTCQCGNQKPVATNNLVSKSKFPKSCGCAAKRHRDQTGKKFSSWYVESISHIENNNAYYHVVCDCGSRQLRDLRNIQSGASRSCGCQSYKKDLTDNAKPAETETSLGSDIA